MSEARKLTGFKNLAAASPPSNLARKHEQLKTDMGKEEKRRKDGSFAKKIVD